jgi:deoxycytidylate deaminase
MSLYRIAEYIRDYKGELLNEEPYPSFFRLAKRVSKLSDYKIKMGCVITNKQTVISVACNKLKYNKKWCNPVKKFHAEALCVKLAERDGLSGCTVYVYRENRFGVPRLAKPCADCEKLLRDKHVKRIYYSTNEFPYYAIMEL